MRQYSGLQVLSFMVLLLGAGLALTSLATNYWSFYSYSADVPLASLSLKFAGGRRGLWEQCYDRVLDSSQHCAYRFQQLAEDLERGELRDVHSVYDVWEIACLGLMALSTALSIISLIFAPFLCARCGCCLSIFVLIAGLSAAAGVCSYTYFHLTGKSASLPQTEEFISIKVKPESFGYSYWCAVGAAIGQLLAAVFFAAGRGRSHDYSQTI